MSTADHDSEASPETALSHDVHTRIDADPHITEDLTRAEVVALCTYYYLTGAANQLHSVRAGAMPTFSEIGQRAETLETEAQALLDAHFNDNATSCDDNDTTT